MEQSNKIMNNLKAKILELEGRLKESDFNIQEVDAIEKKYQSNIIDLEFENKVIKYIYKKIKKNERKCEINYFLKIEKIIKLHYLTKFI